MRGLNDEGNPYAGRYDKWDEWIIASAPGSSAKDVYAWHRGEAPGGYTVLVTAVDKDGFVIPALDYIRARNDPNSEVSSSSCTFLLEAGGQIDSELLQSFREAAAKAKAAWVAEVPAWLAENPPKLAQFYNGEVITYGEQGSGSGVWEDSLPEVLGPGADDMWQRWSMDGELLAATGNGEQWWRLYFPNLAEVLDSLGGEAEVNYFAYQGYVVFWDNKTQAVMAVYDYTGAEQPKDTDFFSGGFEDPMFKPIAGGELPWIYVGQQEMEKCAGE